MEKDTLKVFCDGGARGNPGDAAAAFVVEENGKVIHKGSKYLGETTNNVAEYNGVILALKWLTENKSSCTNLEFYLDSELVVKQLSGSYKVKNENLRNLFLTIKELEKNISQSINYYHISRSKNTLADFLVNKTLDEKISRS